jgi:subtilisin family serine protease
VGATVPGRYIVELSTEPVAARVATMGKRGLRSQAAASHRAVIHAEHDRARAALAKNQASVVESMDTVINALVVQVPDARVAALASVPGVKRVHPERLFHIVLDHALPLHKVPDAWNMVGADNAGAGMKIAIIDTGIDSSHPGFQDASLSIPDGFPKVNNDSDVAYTSNKIIVARSYASLFARRDPDPSARDHIGHGTATSMAAAGVLNAGPLATISGVAPKAWLGSYKVFGSPGVNDTASESAILKALDDAVADGMDVINISLGSNVASLPANDPEVTAIEQASALGVIVVVAAGNNGPDPATVGSPATAPSAVAVGASDNDRIFEASATVADGTTYAAIPGADASAASATTGPMVDVASLDGNGLACAALPAGGLNGSIALILRGTCTFEQKLNNAQQAGAIAALVYTDSSEPDAIPMATGAATLPSEMVSYSDGIAIKQSGTSSLTLDFTVHPNYTSPDGLADFTSMGPNPDGAIKPDLVAVGVNLYTAAEKTDPNGDLYDPSGYGVFDGTSFSTPLVTGAAALVKAARPGLTAAQYRSLLINNTGRISYTPGTQARVQQAGSGVLDVSAALRATAAMAPTSISFGIGATAAPISRSLSITNVGAASETYSISAVPTDGAPVPALSTASVTLDPGASATVSLSFPAPGLSAGQYEGFIAVTGASSGVESRVPYWYAIANNAPAFITVIDTATTLRRGALVSDALVFHVADGSGIVLPNIQPTVTVVSGGGSVVAVVPRTSEAPGAFGVNVRLGATAGTNVFRITVGSISLDVPLISN